MSEPLTQKVTTFLWYESGAEEAARYYVSLLPDSRIVDVARFGDEIGGSEGGAAVVRFTLGGVEYQAFDGGPGHPFTWAASLMVLCDEQEEVDRLWEALTAGGGAPSQCGWLSDRWGLSWQIVPRVLLELQAGEDRERARRVNEAMLKMGKLDIAGLLAAAEAGQPA
jgi:predicted 3-demethylubiquinone-9 3-methyltransferase (glyoxalase superfamily)